MFVFLCFPFDPPAFFLSFLLSSVGWGFVLCLPVDIFYEELSLFVGVVWDYGIGISEESVRTEFVLYWMAIRKKHQFNARLRCRLLPILWSYHRRSLITFIQLSPTLVGHRQKVCYQHATTNGFTATRSIPIASKPWTSADTKKRIWIVQNPCYCAGCVHTKSVGSSSPNRCHNIEPGAKPRTPSPCPAFHQAWQRLFPIVYYWPNNRSKTSQKAGHTADFTPNLRNTVSSWCFQYPKNRVVILIYRYRHFICWSIDASTARCRWTIQREHEKPEWSIPVIEIEPLCRGCSVITLHLGTSVTMLHVTAGSGWVLNASVIIYRTLLFLQTVSMKT